MCNGQAAVWSGRTRAAEICHGRSYAGGVVNVISRVCTPPFLAITDATKFSSSCMGRKPKIRRVSTFLNNTPAGDLGEYAFGARSFPKRFYRIRIRQLRTPHVFRPVRQLRLTPCRIRSGLKFMP